MERILNYTLLSDGASPSESACGGIQGEHKATAIMLSLDEGLAESIETAKSQGGPVECRIDFITSAGEYFEGKARALSQIGEPFYLTEAMTASGLDSVVLVRFILADRREIYKAQIKLFFEKSLFYKTLPKAEPSDNLKQTAEEIFAEIDRKLALVETALNSAIASVRADATSSAEQLKLSSAAASAAENFAAEAKVCLEGAKASTAECGSDTELVKQLYNEAQGYASLAEQAKISAKEDSDFAKGYAERAELAEKNLQQSLSGYYTKEETDGKIGDIEAALDVIIELQEGYIGGDAI